MPVPKQRHTKSRQGKRRSHHSLKKVAVFICPKCGQPILPHQVCFNCGFYNKREVIDTLKKLTKKERKKKEKEMKTAEKAPRQGSGQEQKKEEKGLDMSELSKKI